MLDRGKPAEILQLQTNNIALRQATLGGTDCSMRVYLHISGFDPLFRHLN